MSVNNYDLPDDSAVMLREVRRLVQGLVTSQRKLSVAWRDRLLKQVDEIERETGITPRTAEMRRWWRDERG